MSNRITLLHFALIAVLTVGCSVRVQPDNAEFDKLCGKGPVLIVPNDETALGTAFFRRHWATSETIKHLVTQRGTPEAIGIEREFLQPNRLKLFYPGQGQVYLLDQVGGEWLVAGSEPLETAELELVTTQRAKLPHVAPAGAKVSDIVPSKPMTDPIAAVAPDEFRGMLKPPSTAAVAKLTKVANESYLHTVSFPGEDLQVLADWYTDDATNAKLLADKNRRKLHTALRVGEQISIPGELMRNPEPLPEAMVP